jgi:uncharacterized protein
MSHDDCDLMEVNVARFLNHPGKRFPVAVEWHVLPQGDVRFIDALSVCGTAFLQLDALYFDVQITGAIERPCCRCLAPVHLPVALHETFEIIIPANEDAVDLAPHILGSVLSSLPPHPLCRSTCRGLCPVCGANLNERPDHVCGEATQDRRTLRDFWYE